MGRYTAAIEWDAEDVDSPVQAALLVWSYVRRSTGPVVDVVDEHGVKTRVDLSQFMATAPGELREVGRATATAGTVDPCFDCGRAFNGGQPMVRAADDEDGESDDYVLHEHCWEARQKDWQESQK